MISDIQFAAQVPELFKLYFNLSAIRQITIHIALILTFLCEQAKSQSARPDTISTPKGRFAVQYMPFNSSSSDFCAVFWNKGVVFSSNRVNSVVRYTTEDNILLTDIFFTEKNGNGRWKPATSFSSEINSKFNDGPICFNRSGDTCFFNRNSPEGALQIYYDVLKEGKWQGPVALPFNSATYSVAHPSIASNSHALYFCSDMPGGEGGKDLYVSRYINGSWSSPENLGKGINTAKDEMFPFIAPDGHLYFASDGHPGKGGLDIFSAESKHGTWTSVQNHESFNSDKDDFAFLLDTSFTKGFFSSNRHKGDDDDIYYFELVEPSFPQPDTVKENDFCLTLFEESTNLIDTLPYRYEWNLGKALTVKAKEVYHCFPGPGSYPVYLKIIDTLANNTLVQQINYQIDLEAHEQLYIACPDTIREGIMTSFDASSSNLPGCSIKSYYWDFGDSKKGKGVKTEHAFSRPGTYYVRLGCELLTADKKETSRSVIKKIVVVK